MIPQQHSLAGKTAVITGAASGLGLAIARAGAARSMALVLADNRPVPLRSVCEELLRQGAEVLDVETDVASAAEIARLADVTIERFGAPHLVVNNAGIFAGGLIWEQSAAQWERVLRVNLLSVAYGVTAFVPPMLAAAKADPSWRGQIVNTASVAGLIGLPLGSAYGVSKHGVVALSEILHHDLAACSDQVTCAVLCPHFVETALAARPTGSEPPTHSQKLARKLVQGAMAQGRLDADAVAEILFAGLSAGAFYIHTHPEHLGGLAARRRDLARGTDLTPYEGEIDLAPLLRRASPRRIDG